jgi:hypothetical protein
MTPRLLAASIALFAATGALAETSPWYVGAAQGFTHTSNVRLVPDGQAAQSSTISVTTLLAGLDQPIGRQRLSGGLTLRHLGYSGASDLNNNSYDLNLGLDWATVERVSGRISAQAGRRLEQLATLDQNANLVGLKNLQDTRSLNAVARLGVVTTATLEASLGWREQKLSLAGLSNQEFHSTSASVGGRYRFSGSLTAGAALRHSEYTYPNYSPTESDRVTRNDLDLTATWVASGASSLSGRISLGRSRHSVGNQPGFSGLTGQLGWLWKPTGKIKLDSSLQRDTGVESGVRYEDRNLATVSLVDDSRLTTSLATRASYEVTGKINATASLRLARRDLTRNSVAVSDNSQGLALGLTWAPTRSVQVGCDIGRDRRKSSNAGQLQPYGVNTFGCYAQLILQ